MAGGTDEFAENGDVWTIDADSPGIHRQTETFGQVEIYASVIKFRETVALRGRNPIQTRRIHRTGWTVTTPRAASSTGS